jgi:hypothetical protein
MNLDFSFLQSMSLESARGLLIIAGIAFVVALSTFYLLGLVISRVTLVVHWVMAPWQRLASVWARRIPFPESVSLVFQYAIGASFVLVFVFQAGKAARIVLDFLTFASGVVLALLVVAGWLFWRAEHYLEEEHVPRELARIVYYHRFVKPVWDWVAYQSYSLLWLDRIPVLRPVVTALDGVARQVNRRKWQVFLRCLLAFSIFTLPVQLFPGVDAKVSSQFATWIRDVNPDWLTVPMRNFGEFYLYLFDWTLTVVFLFFVVSIFAPLEPQNMFPSVVAALSHFVGKGRPFVFASYFWQHELGEYEATSCWSEDPLPSRWEEFARSLHRQTVELDKYLPSTRQGVNSRVSCVLEDESAPESKAWCVHYRRFGESAFVVAVGSDASRYEGRGIIISQSDFLQLSEAIGLLVNVRHSLKQGSPRLASRGSG